MTAKINPRKYVEQICSKADLSKQSYDFRCTFSMKSDIGEVAISAKVHQYIVEYALSKKVQILIQDEKVHNTEGRVVMLDVGNYDIEAICENILTRQANGKAATT